MFLPPVPCRKVLGRIKIANGIREFWGTSIDVLVWGSQRARRLLTYSWKRQKRAGKWRYIDTYMELEKLMNSNPCKRGTHNHIVILLSKITWRLQTCCVNIWLAGLKPPGPPVVCGVESEFQGMSGRTVRSWISHLKIFLKSTDSPGSQERPHDL